MRQLISKIAFGNVTPMPIDSYFILPINSSLLILDCFIMLNRVPFLISLFLGTTTKAMLPSSSFLCKEIWEPFCLVTEKPSLCSICQKPPVRDGWHVFISNDIAWFLMLGVPLIYGWFLSTTRSTNQRIGGTPLFRTSSAERTGNFILDAYFHRDICRYNSWNYFAFLEVFL